MECLICTMYYAFSSPPTLSGSYLLLTHFPDKQVEASDVMSKLPKALQSIWQGLNLDLVI